MRLMFVYYAFETQGSGLVIQGYTEAARALGHEVAVYGTPNPRIPLNYSLDIASADAVIFIFEWTTYLENRDNLDFVRLVSKVPRRRRVILDGDGNYNDVITVDGDYNHRDAAASHWWTEVCDSLSDKVCQPTLAPRRPNVRPFLFYAYSPGWDVAFDGTRKEYDMIYVGHSKFRWHPMQRVLEAVEPVREQLGRIALVGEGWGGLPWWAVPLGMEESYRIDSAYLTKLAIEVMPPVPFSEVIAWMSKAVFSPVLLRPTFRYMRLVTPRLFETPAAATIPLFALDKTHVQEIYGDAGLELALTDDGAGKILDIVQRPKHYTNVVKAIRHHLGAKHSHRARLRELIEIVES
jgi:hypothetical protein